MNTMTDRIETGINKDDSESVTFSLSLSSNSLCVALSRRTFCSFVPSNVSISLFLEYLEDLLCLIERIPEMVELSSLFPQALLGEV